MAWYLVSILGLALLMVVHEAGHLAAARAFGMRVNTFSIGFGPTFFKIEPKDGFFWLTALRGRLRLRLRKHDPDKHGPTVYQVAMIPFLAYVQIAGMNPFEEHDPNDKGSYANARLFARISTIFAGPLANYLFASVLFFFSFYYGGVMQADGKSTEVNVMPDYPAAAAGIKDGDRIVEVEGTAVGQWDEMAKNISKHPDEPITIVVERAGQRVSVKVQPKKQPDGRGIIGVETVGHRVAVSLGEATKLAITRPPRVVRDLVVGLAQLISGKVEAKLGGPVMIIREGAGAAKRGMADWLALLAIISAYLGAFNLVPFPALDGGRLIFLGYELATRRRPNARLEAHIHVVGLVMLLGLMLYVTIFNDFHLGGGK
jgi:regulator of sigma E protease